MKSRRGVGSVWGRGMGDSAEVTVLSLRKRPVHRESSGRVSVVYGLSLLRRNLR